MLYPKNTAPELDEALFRNPTAEYRATPFWAWNCELNPEILKRQIEVFKKMGFGGFHMHSRTGMATRYLSKEFMELVRVCTEKAKAENMLAWLYDEDRWPSGAAGGYVTKNPEFRARYLLFTPRPYGRGPIDERVSISASVGRRAENGTLLAKYRVELDENGFLRSYRFAEPEETGEDLWYAYMEMTEESPWFNNQTYVNTLDKRAVDEFIRITYEAYKEAVGEEFGKTVPAIFTDEPQFTHKTLLTYAKDKTDLFLPWTDDLPETFARAYGDDLLRGLPELFWELPEGRVSRLRYRYHDHIAERFARAFSYNCGEWCRKNGLMLTGHMMEEPTLRSQTAALGEAMRSYAGFDLPGIDMLCDLREYTTAVQARSAVRQYGREGMMSELYGVTNWDFDFRGHKLQGDWQAALGVTVRVPHLAWVSMGGEAKRDYPASIGYQVPWHEEYALLENHFARLNTALTRGRPAVRTAVIHPVESYWLYWGPNEQTADIRRQMDENFRNVTEWLLFGQIDFDFVCESLLPSLCPEGGNPLRVGETAYDAVVVPGCVTLRSSTAERLRAFAEAGGLLVVAGEAPRFLDAEPIEEEPDFLRRALRIPFERHALLRALEPVREAEIRLQNGERADRFLIQMRRDGADRWFFAAQGRKPHNDDLSRPCPVNIFLRGRWVPKIYDTLTGEIRPAPVRYEGDRTVVSHVFYDHDSLLLRLTPGTARSSAEPAQPATRGTPEGMFGKVPVRLSEPNVLLLDMAEYAFDDEEYRPADEILRIGTALRKRLGWHEEMTQPWVIPPEEPRHSVRLRYLFESEVEAENVLLALEEAEKTKIRFNGRPVEAKTTGYYVDEAIRTVPLPAVRRGQNVLELQVPFGSRTSLEACCLLGDFGVRVRGFEKTLTAPVRELAFGDIVPQGLPFYGGNLEYRLTVRGDGRPLTVRVPYYRGSLVGVTLDGVRAGTAAFAPYAVTLPALSEGPHEIGLILFGNRYNTFGALHNCDRTLFWAGPECWRSQGDAWTYEYRFRETGILKSPVLIRE